ncbi:unnamed protein product [Sphagnum tenellum]
MSRAWKPKGSKELCEDDLFKTNHPVHSHEGEDENRSPNNASGTPRLQGVHSKLAAKDQHCLHSVQEDESDDRRVLLAITVEIEDGSVEHIEMKEGDSAEAVATKFCLKHSLPDQFVAPLTEHIISNIMSISNEDKDIVFCSKDECHSYKEKWPTCVNKVASGHIELNEYDQENKHTRSHACKFQPVNFPLSQSENINKFGSGKACLSSPKPRRKYAQKRVSDQLIAPTVTSLAKIGGHEPKKEDRPKSASAHPLPERAKTVYMRLYAEFVRQRQKLEDDKKRNLELYQEKLERDKTSISKKSWRIMRMRGRTAKQYRNYGELLYMEGLTKKENQMKLIKQKQSDDEARELAQLTLMPEISKRAKSIRREQGQVWKRLQCQEKPRQDQLQELRNELWEAKLMECTFTPQINHRRMGDGGREDMKDGPFNRFELLFMDAESRRRRQTEYMQWYPEGVTFQPAVNRRQVDGLDMDGDYNQEGNVFNRLLQYASKLTEKKQLREQLCHRPIDPNTGRKFFRPRTGRKPQNDRNPVHLPIGEFLYSLKSALDNKMESLAERDQKVKRDQANCRYVGPKSQKLLGRIKERGFKQVFDSLDEDKDGFVQLATANLQQLCKETIYDVTQVMKMGATDKPLSFDNFVDLMLAVEKKYHKGAKVHLGLKHKDHTDLSNFTYQFKMDRLSRNLAARRRRFNSSRQWYKLICMDRERRQQKVEEMRKERQEMEMSQCTFRPELISRGTIKESHKRRVVECDSTSSIVEKVQQEVHGFYFQDEQGPEWLGLPASVAANEVSHAPSSTAVLDDSYPDKVGPLGMLESLKCIVSGLLKDPAARMSSLSLMKQQPKSSTKSYISTIDHLPRADVKKNRLFLGIMEV